MQIEMGVIGATHHIRNVPDFDNRDRSSVAGMFAEMRYLLVGRGPGSPIGVTLAVEPEIARLDDSSGGLASRYGTEMRLEADTELVPNRLFMAVNALFEPEWVHQKNALRWERETTLGLSSALAYRITPEVVVGSEVGFFRKYDHLAFGKVEGQALYVGPTLYVQLTKKAFLQAAWSTQVWGREGIERGERARSVMEALEAGEDALGALPPHHHHRDLAHFERHRAKLKIVYEF